MMNVYSKRCTKGKYFKENQYDQDKVKILYRKLKSGDWYMDAKEAFTDLLMG